MKHLFKGQSSAIRRISLANPSADHHPIPQRIISHTESLAPLSLTYSLPLTTQKINAYINASATGHTATPSLSTLVAPYATPSLHGANVNTTPHVQHTYP